MIISERLKHSIDMRAALYSSIFSIPVAILLTLGYNYISRGSSQIVSSETWVLCLLIFTPLFICATILLSLMSSKTALQELKDSGAFGFADEGRWASKKSHLAVFLTLCIAWLPYFLACFPGLYVYDALTQTHYAIGMQEINSFHPLIHTYWLSSCMIIGRNLLGSISNGFAIYTISQYVLYALMLSAIVKNLGRLGSPVFLRLAAVAFFALFPVFPIMAISATKDTIFSGALVLLFIHSWRLLKDPQSYLQRRSNMAALAFYSLLVSAFRNNGIYVVAALFLIMLLCLSQERKILAKTLIPSLVLAVLISNVFPAAISVGRSTVVEMLGVPIQQMARVANQFEGSLDDEDAEAISIYIPSWKNYRQGIADPVKFSDQTINNISEDVSGFITAWLRIGMKHPQVYLDAFIAMTIDYWYPFIHYSTAEKTKPYLEYYAWELTDSTTISRQLGNGLFEEYAIDPNEGWLFVERHSLLPEFETVVEHFCYDAPWTSNWLSNCIFSTGTISILLYFIFIATMYLGKKLQSISLLVPGVYLATCLLGPVFLIRYALPLLLSYPVLLSMFWSLLPFDVRTKSKLVARKESTHSYRTLSGGSSPSRPARRRENDAQM